MAVERMLFQTRAVWNIFGESRDHRLTFVANRSGQQHALRFIAAQLTRFQVGYNCNLPPEQPLGLIVLRYAGENLPRLLFSNVNGKQQKLISFWDTLSR